MARLRSRYFLAVLGVIAALVTAFLRKNESAVPQPKPAPALTKEVDVPHEIEMEQTAELLRANKAREPQEK